MVRAMTNNSFQPKQSASFADLEDKSLDQGDVASKEDDASDEDTDSTEAPAEGKSRVTVPVKMLHHASEVVDGEVKHLLPGHPYDLPRGLANRLVDGKRAVRR